jgi:DNA polymerase III delta prime subunit
VRSGVNRSRLLLTTGLPVNDNNDERKVPNVATRNRAQAEADVHDLPLTRNAVAIVPPREMYDTYISRKIAKVADMDMFDYARKNKINVLIEGPTGAGKTSAALAYAAREKMPFYATPSSIGLEPSQLFGRYIPTDDRHFVWQDGPVTHLVRYGGLLLINEINFIPERVSTVLFSLLDKRRVIQLLDHKGEVITAHDDLMIVADMNPEYRGTRPLNAALRNRFGIQQFWDYDPAIEKRLLPYPAVIEMAKKLRVSEEINTPVSTNMLSEFVEQAISSLGYDFAVNGFVSRFANDERAVVSQTLDLFTTKLRQEILKVVPKRQLQDDAEEWDSDQYDLTVVGTKDNPNPINFPGWNPSMGVYNVDWNISVEEDE